MSSTSRATARNWIQHGDRRRFTITESMGALLASREGHVVCSRTIGLSATLAEARELLTADVLALPSVALPSVYLPDPLPPVLDAISRARKVATWVTELDACEARAVELRALIGAALGGQS